MWTPAAVKDLIAFTGWVVIGVMASWFFLRLFLGRGSGR